MSDREESGPPSSRGQPVAPASPAERDRTAASLCRHFARDHLDVAELERRLDLAYAARSLPELRGLLSDLPELPPEATPTTDPVTAAGPVVNPALDMAERETLMGIMGGSERSGAWIPARHTVTVALMGETALDLRQARLGAPEIRITAVAIMGEVQVIVPPGLRVEASGSALMGGFEHRADGPAPPPGAPVVRIDGVALMGSVGIVVRLPGESAREARKRRKAEQRKLKGESRRLTGQ